MPKFSVTYEIITHESAEHGEVEERGFVDQDCTLREAIDLIGDYVSEADSCPISRRYPPRWFTNHEYDNNWSTGARESRSLHLPRNCTPSSALRIARLLGVKTN